MRATSHDVVRCRAHCEHRFTQVRWRTLARQRLRSTSSSSLTVSRTRLCPPSVTALFPAAHNRRSSCLDWNSLSQVLNTTRHLCSLHPLWLSSGPNYFNTHLFSIFSAQFVVPAHSRSNLRWGHNNRLFTYLFSLDILLIGIFPRGNNTRSFVFAV